MPLTEDTLIPVTQKSPFIIHRDTLVTTWGSVVFDGASLAPYSASAEKTRLKVHVNDVVMSL